MQSQHKKCAAHIYIHTSAMTCLADAAVGRGGRKGAWLHSPDVVVTATSRGGEWCSEARLHGRLGGCDGSSRRRTSRGWHDDERGGRWEGAAQECGGHCCCGGGGCECDDGGQVGGDPGPAAHICVYVRGRVLCGRDGSVVD